MKKKYIIKDLVSGRYLRTEYIKLPNENFGYWFDDFVDCNESNFFKYFLNKDLAKDFVKEYLMKEIKENKVILEIVTIYKKKI